MQMNKYFFNKKAINSITPTAILFNFIKYQNKIEMEN